ncbi:MAG: AlpA family phage regulatory protein [Verrucomicrobia bacterium]|nr:AlpA family phage regulatory protein [Verrucomicrobiota bacterium]
MNTIPETGFVRLPEVLNVIPIGKTCWWEGVKSGRFPKPVKLSARCTAWRAEDIRELISELSKRKPFQTRKRLGEALTKPRAN